MTTIKEPPKRRILLADPIIQFNTNPALLRKFKMMRVNTQVTNILNEPPTVDKIYTYKGKNYGWPEFRILPQKTKSNVPGQQGFRFSKDKDNTLHLNVIVEAFHKQVNVIPLDFREIRLAFRYEGTDGIMELPLTVSNILPINKPNILKHISAHTVVREEDKEVIYKALTTPTKESKVMVSADIWWQRPASGNTSAPPPRPVPKKPPKLMESCLSFDRGKLRIQGTHVYAGNQKLMSFRNVQDAQKAVRVVQHYKMDRRCTVGGDRFSYFLSGNAAPAGAIKGEDCLPFDPSKLKVIQAGGRWKITDGRSWMFDFNTNRANAEKALAVIKKHGFDATCYVGRPKPGMTYLKRTRAPKPLMFNFVFNTVTAASLVKPTLAKTWATSTVQARKVVVSDEEPLNFERKDPTVFQGFFDELESPEYKWFFETVPSVNDQDAYTFCCRLTNDPNKVFFLPQVYRIGVDNETGEPQVRINMYARKGSSGKNEYRIKMEFDLKPYFHPGAKKDLMRYLQSTWNIKYAERLVLGGYQNVSFRLEDRFLKDNVTFSESFTERAEGIDPTAGFTITADHSLESFDVFKSELLTNGIAIGKVYFELEEVTQEGESIRQSRPITVELNFAKLVDIPLETQKIDVGNEGTGAPPPGFYLKNNTDIPVTVKNVELALISKVENVFHEVYLDLATVGTSWPLTMDPLRKETILINQANVELLSDENTVWTGLVCEPHGIRAKIDPEKIMATVIDRATNEPEMWKLDISCPFFEEPETWSVAEKERFKGLKGILVELKVDDDDEVFSVELNASNPREEIEMARTLRQLLDRSKQENQRYTYRQTNITDPESPPGQWKPFEHFAVKHLRIDPEI